MTEQLKFEVGKCYRTRCGKKATVLLIRPTYIVGEIEGMESENPWHWNVCGGWHPEAVPVAWDLVSEWREPARVMARVFRHRISGNVEIWRVAPNPDWQLIAQREIVEGEGLT
jgi:hypothetical protein